MILRFFRAITHQGMENEFGKFFLGTMLPIVRKQDGLISVSVGRPHENSPSEYSMVMVWRDLDALKGFSGEDWEKPVIHPDEKHLLKETHLYHYYLAED